MTIQKFFPFSPAYSSWEDWNGNLIMFYGEEPIPASIEANWKDTAHSLVQLSTFSSYPVPSPDRFATWQEWASEFTQIVNGPTR
jgi:hypothetical protein